MPVKMRLRRMGAKHQPSYRIVIADSRSPRDGRYIDQIGFYNPLTNPATVTVNQSKAVDWLRKGAQPTETVAILLGKFGIDPAQARKGEYVPGPTPAGAARPIPAALGSPITGSTESLNAAAAGSLTSADAGSLNPANAGEETLTVEPGEIPFLEEPGE